MNDRSCCPHRIVIYSTGGEEASDKVEVLSMRVDELHEIAPKLAALYPVPARSHKRKAKEGT